MKSNKNADSAPAKAGANQSTPVGHTPGAIRIAELLVPGIDNKGRRGTIRTEWGRKTREGIADLIDRETHAPALLEALKACDRAMGSDSRWDVSDVRMRARAAIARAGGDK